jgi:hypothetical protein
MRTFPDVCKWYYSHEKQLYQVAGDAGGYYLTETEMRAFASWAQKFLETAAETEVPTLSQWLAEGGTATAILQPKGRGVWISGRR